MPSDETSGPIVELLMTHEKILAELYLLYAERYYEYEDYWMQMHREELGHVDLILSLELQVADGVAIHNFERINAEALRAIVQYARTMFNHVKKQWPTLSAAIGIAMDLEDSIVEKGIFDLYVADSPETRKAFEQMRATFTEHFNSLAHFRDVSNQNKHWGPV